MPSKLIDCLFRRKHLIDSDGGVISRISFEKKKKNTLHDSMILSNTISDCVLSNIINRCTFFDLIQMRTISHRIQQIVDNRLLFIHEMRILKCDLIEKTNGRGMCSLYIIL